MDFFLVCYLKNKSFSAVDYYSYCHTELRRPTHSPAGSSPALHVMLSIRSALPVMAAATVGCANYAYAADSALSGKEFRPLK